MHRQRCSFCKSRSFIAGDNCGPKNYRFEKVLLGPQQSVGQALFGQLARRVTGENIPLMKVSLNGDSVTYYANYGQHVVIYQLAQGETISVESENILAFTQDCDYSVRFIGVGVLSPKRSCYFHTYGQRQECICCRIVRRQPCCTEQCWQE